MTLVLFLSNLVAVYAQTLSIGLAEMVNEAPVLGLTGFSGVTGSIRLAGMNNEAPVSGHTRVLAQNSSTGVVAANTIAEDTSLCSNTRLDSLIPVLMERYKVPGVSCVVIKRGEIVWAGNFGVSDIRKVVPVSDSTTLNAHPKDILPKNSTPVADSTSFETHPKDIQYKNYALVTDSTMFEACSMSKPIFSLVAMKLVEEEKLKLDEPVWKIFDDPSFMGQEWRKKITPRMLLTHTSGLPNWRESKDEENGYLPIEFEPGTRFQYSGEGMYLLQKVVEKLTGEPLEVLAEKLIFSKLGLKNSSFIWRQNLDYKIAAGHNSEGGFLKKTAYTRANAGYSLYCSALDYARVLTAILKSGEKDFGFLLPATVDTIFSRQAESPEREPEKRCGKRNGIKTFRGLGWAIDETEGSLSPSPSPAGEELSRAVNDPEKKVSTLKDEVKGKLHETNKGNVPGDIFYHSGSNSSGFKCYHEFDRQSGSGIVIMTNGVGGLKLCEDIIFLGY
ncbi:MAG: beta-lactamase family protein [Ignavibacteriales bacterium]|jgi:Beta-lactamase class C and other penicillin binding proteins|nr:hypothetical protein [Ignavibacteriaceae bacterium]MBW7874138.1 beta-lactamase family protein [Ignavibacteria bacterium]MBZ0197922.1 beta-lactamase family protein [Ignavibacteriaceae bacterium]MCZ2142913.1 beta-lactamase family protein [Ignavibacteriales bacterium]WKZ73910.1 MAG: serine hydrolase domain-containing protein [Ignavibacteriaceae bacterium]